MTTEIHGHRSLSRKVQKQLNFVKLLIITDTVPDGGVHYPLCVLPCSTNRFTEPWLYPEKKQPTRLPSLAIDRLLAHEAGAHGELITRGWGYVHIIDLAGLDVAPVLLRNVIFTLGLTFCTRPDLFGREKKRVSRYISIAPPPLSPPRGEVANNPPRLLSLGPAECARLKWTD